MNQHKAQSHYSSKHQQSEMATSQTTLLSSSEQINYKNIVQNLPQEQSQQDKNSLTLNIIQSFGSDMQIPSFEALLRNGVSVNLRDSDNKTLLMIASEKGSLDLVSKLLELEAHLELKDNWGKTALFYAIDAKQNNLQIVSFLLDKGADPNAKCKNGTTPLFRAVEINNLLIVETLLKKKCNIFVKQESTGDTLLHLAGRKGDKAMVKLLLEHGCDPKKKNKKKQALRDICKENSEILAKIKKEEVPFIKRVNSESSAKNHENSFRKGKKEQGKGEFGKGGRNGQMKGRENLQEIHEVFNFNTVPIPSTNPNNLNESPSVPLVLANRNDDNYSNASTSYSNAHSEIQFQPKTTNPPLTVLNHHSDDPNKYSEKNSQYINRNQDNQRKREDSGVSRTSITSAHSDMVSDNESMSTHSQNNLASSLHMQRFSPDIQEKTISSSSIGNNEASGPYFMNNHQAFNRDFQNSQPYLNSDKNFNKQQKRKSKNFSNKPPFQNNEVYNTDYVPQYNNGVDQGFDVQNSPPMHNINYNNNLRPSNQMKRNFNENLSSPQTNLQYSNGKNNIHKNNPNFSDKIGQEKNYQIIHSDNNNENPLYAFNQFQNREQSYNEMPIMLNNGGGQNVFFFNPPQHFQGKGGHSDPLTKMFKGFQEGQNMMMNSGMPYKMQPNQIYFNQQHPPLPNGQRNMPLHANNQVQQENIGLKDKLNSTVKSAKECKRELENAKTENTELKALIEATTLTTKGLEEFLKEKDETLQKLITLNEDLQASIKQINPDFVFDGHQSQACSTHGLLHDFSSSTMEEILFETQTNSSALKTDHISSVLNEEIVSFEKAVDSYFKENQAVLESLLNMIQTSMMELVPDAECIIYGSFATGLWLPWSDIDLVVKIPQAEAAYSILELLESTLKEKEWIAEVKTIKNTAVPLLKVVCTNAYLQQKFDITIKDFRHNELSCVNLVKEYLVKYPPLRPLSLVLKHLINTLGLNQTYSGGLSSYGLLLMVVFLLQRKESERASYSSENYNLGELLLSFLQSYGFEYDYYSQYVVNPERILKNGEITNYHLNEANLMNMIKTQQPSFNNPRIIIQDPVSSQNNVGRSTFRIKEIKNAFMAAYFEALKPCTCKVHEYIEKIDNLEEKKEFKCASLLKRMFLAYQVGQ